MSTPKTRRVTLADVAAASGVSKTAVSLILNNRPDSRISEQTAARVRQTANDLGYRPNLAAQSLRFGKTRTLGFISEQVTVTRFASGMITGILRAAKQHDHTVLMAETFGEEPELRQAIAQMSHREVDGLILGFMDSRLRELPGLESEVPVVLVNGHDTQPRTCIMPDEFAAGSTVAHRLQQAAITRVALIGTHRRATLHPESYPSITRRFAGLTQALAAEGIGITGQWELEDWNPSDGFTATRAMLAGNQPPQALICANDRVAMGAYQALAEHGLRPGIDMPVISFDDEDIAAYLRPALTTVRLPYEQMGEKAVELLLGGQLTADEHLVPMPLIERDSLPARR
ncbi:LacI family DNA-binding transcriptional regulator [Glutamicibacter sp. MNS18]|uniref:LacI family DNA-binding transcriptional regulator n=1 Tax=Glutamicibacter sp. MNS18 TaxID=2989817 RepID=UPI0022361664|nr:LacI family DNA-binding transcriptional regulator [Glutamicibacter sp. MNS18]MCW4465407.1 LacI family DNA-binding transcriptional regulator [Glutamicibacter sp. MNS18]